MRRWLPRILIALSGAVALAALLLWLSVRASLPTLDGEILLEGLDASVAIERDASGIPTIRARSRTDLAFASGFLHAQDRFFQMDLIRRQAAGELSELFGSGAVYVDRRYRFHRFRARARAVIAGLDDSGRALLDAYTAGVNAGLAELSVRPFEYLLLRESPREWVAEDSLLVVYAMFMQLNDDRARKDVRRGLAKTALPRTVYEWLYPQGTAWDAPIVGEPRQASPVPGPDDYSIRDVTIDVDPADEKGRPLLNGSNNWAVGGALTADGRALVSNDMHLGLSVPNIYYQMRLVTTEPPRRDITGVSLPGTPFIVAGSNGRVAWGYTNSYGDWSDAVIVHPGSTPGTYRTADGEQRFTTHTETIQVRGEEPVAFDIRETRWGPVDEDLTFEGATIAVRWLAHMARAVNLNIIDLETAGDVETAMSIANTLGIPPQNFVAGDARGNIGWTIAGQVPLRREYDAIVPADWSDGDGWAGWLSPVDYPRVINPASGRIWTANARVVDGEALAMIGDGGYDLAARARQIRDRLFEQSSFEPEDMLAIQTDTDALFLSRWQRLLLDVLDADSDDPGLREYRQLVANWIPSATAESVGYRLVRAFRLGVRKTLFDALAVPVREKHGGDANPLISNQFEGPLWSLVSERPAHLLPANFASWAELFDHVVRRQLERFDQEFDGGLSDRTWGEYNTARIRHPLSQAAPWLSGWLDMPADPLDGDANLPLAQGRNFGASQRFSVAPGDEANGLMHMPTGQSGHPLSPFYRRGHADWVNGKPSPFLPGRAAYSLRLLPAP